MQLFITIALGIACVIATVFILVTADLWKKGLHWVWRFLIEIFRWSLAMSTIVAYIAALSSYENYDSENKILLDILKNGTKPTVEHTIRNGDTIQIDRYFINPEDTSDYPMRYPINKKARLGIEVDE